MPRRPRKPLPTALQGRRVHRRAGELDRVGPRAAAWRRPGATLPWRPGDRRGSESACWLTAGTRAPRAVHALLVALPVGAFFSHVTAARLWPFHLPPPAAAESLACRRQVSDAIAAQAPALSVTTSTMGPSLWPTVAGLPLVDPATLFCQLASTLPLPDLVAVGDALVLEPVFPDWRDERPWVPLGQLTDGSSYRGRGKVRAARALGPDQARCRIAPGNAAPAGAHRGAASPNPRSTSRCGMGREIHRSWRPGLPDAGESSWSTTATSTEPTPAIRPGCAASGATLRQRMARRPDRGPALLRRPGRVPVPGRPALREAGWNG